MVEFAKFMRKAKIEQATQKVFCPECNKSSFTVFRKESLEQGKIYLHHCKCKECGLLFVFKANLKGEIFVD